MDKKTMELAKHAMKEGEKKAPIKSVKVKVKFDKPKDDDKYEAKKKELAENRK